MSPSILNRAEGMAFMKEMDQTFNVTKAIVIWPVEHIPTVVKQFISIDTYTQFVAFVPEIYSEESIPFLKTSEYGEIIEKYKVEYGTFYVGYNK